MDKVQRNNLLYVCGSCSLSFESHGDLQSHIQTCFKKDDHANTPSQDFGLSLLSSIAASQSEQQTQPQSKIPLPRDPHARPYFMLNASSNQTTADKNTGYLRREWDTKANGFVKWRLPDNNGIPPKNDVHFKRSRRAVTRQERDAEAVIDKVLVPAGAQCVKDSGSLYSKFWLKPVVRNKKSQLTNADKYGFKKFYASKGKPDLVNSVVSEAYQYPQVSYHGPVMGTENGSATQYSVAHQHGISLVQSSDHKMAGSHSTSVTIPFHDGGRKHQIVAPASDYWPVYPMERSTRTFSLDRVKQRLGNERQSEVSLDRDCGMPCPGAPSHQTRGTILEKMLRKKRKSTEAPVSSPLKELLSRRNSYDCPWSMEVDAKKSNLRRNVNERTEQKTLDLSATLTSTLNKDQKDAGVDGNEMIESLDREVITRDVEAQQTGRKRIRFLQDQVKVEEFEASSDDRKRAVSYEIDPSSEDSYTKDDQCHSSGKSFDGHTWNNTDKECDSNQESIDSARNSVSPSLKEPQVDISSFLNVNADKQYQLVPALYKLDSSVCSPPSLQNQAELMLFYYRMLRSNSLEKDSKEYQSLDIRNTDSIIHPVVDGNECASNCISSTDDSGQGTTVDNVTKADGHHIHTQDSSNQTTECRSQLQDVVHTQDSITFADVGCQTENDACKGNGVRVCFKMKEQKSETCQTSPLLDAEFLFDSRNNSVESSNKECKECCKHSVAHVYKNDLRTTEQNGAEKVTRLGNPAQTSELQSLLRGNSRTETFGGHNIRYTQHHLCSSAVELTQSHMVPGCSSKLLSRMDKRFSESCSACTSKCIHDHEGNKNCFAEQKSVTFNALGSEGGRSVVHSHCRSIDLGRISGKSQHWCAGKSESCAHHKSKLTKGLMYCETCCLLSDGSQLAAPVLIKNVPVSEEPILRSYRSQGNVEQRLKARQCAHYNKTLLEESGPQPCCSTQASVPAELEGLEETTADAREGANNPMYFCTKCCLVFESMADYEVHFETSTSCRLGGRAIRRCTPLESGSAIHHQEKSTEMDSMVLKRSLPNSPGRSAKEVSPSDHLGSIGTCDQLMASQEASTIVESSSSSSSDVECLDSRNDLERVATACSGDHLKLLNEMVRMHGVCKCTSDCGNSCVSETVGHCSHHQLKPVLEGSCKCNNDKVIDGPKESGCASKSPERVIPSMMKMETESQYDDCQNCKISEVTATSEQQNAAAKSVATSDTMQTAENKHSPKIAGCRKRKLSVDELALVGRPKPVIPMKYRRPSLCETSASSSPFIGAPSEKGGYDKQIPPLERQESLTDPCNKHLTTSNASTSEKKGVFVTLNSSSCTTAADNINDLNRCKSRQPLSAATVSAQDSHKYLTAAEGRNDKVTLDDRSSQSLSQLQKFVSEHSRPSQNFWRCTSCHILFTTKAEYMDHLDSGACQSCFHEPRKQPATVSNNKPKPDVANAPKFKVISVLLPRPDPSRYYADGSTPKQTLNDPQELDKCARIEPFVRCTRCSVLFTTYRDFESHSCKVDT